ncbi:hypothetical protein ACFYU8_17785 [Brevibacillus sp. NPDC003359]
MIFLGVTEHYGKEVKAYRKVNTDGTCEFLLITQDGQTIRPMMGTY